MVAPHPVLLRNQVAAGDDIIRQLTVCLCCGKRRRVRRWVGGWAGAHMDRAAGRAAAAWLLLSLSQQQLGSCHRPTNRLWARRRTHDSAKALRMRGWSSALLPTEQQAQLCSYGQPCPAVSRPLLSTSCKQRSARRLGPPSLLSIASSYQQLCQAAAGQRQQRQLRSVRASFLARSPAARWTQSCV